MAEDLAQGGARVRVGWGLAGLKALAPHADAMVVVDMLSFSTACAVATRAGAVVVPWNPSDALPSDALVAGRRGEPGWSLSPASLTSIPEGTRLLLPSPSGSRLCAWAERQGLRVHTGCFLDRHSVARAVADASVVAVIAAGEHWPDPGDGIRFALEDWLGAGAVVDALSGTRSPEARAARAAYLEVADDLEGALVRTASGRELVRQGFGADVRIAADSRH